MAAIQTAIRLNDMMSAPIQHIVNAMNIMLSTWDNLEDKTSAGLDANTMKVIKKEVMEADAGLKQLVDEQEKFRKKTEETSDSYRGLEGKIKSAVGALGSLAAIKKVVDISDELTQTEARLGMIADKENDINSLTNKIMASANRARAPYTDMADTVAKLSLNTGKLFKNDEAIQFSENLNKLYKIAGTEASAAAGASMQLTQALGSGVLRGDEFNSVMEAAPNIMQTIADYMEVPLGSLRKMASEGKITADIVKNALLDPNTTKAISEQFDTIPKTWSDVATLTMNKVYYASIPLLHVIGFLADNFEVIEPLVIGVAAAFAVYATAAYGGAAATKVWTAAQAAFNAVMAMNPLALTAITIILVISLIYAAISAINKAQNTSISATGVIIGTVSTLFSFLYNIIAAFINFFVNIWHDPIGAVARLIASLADNVLGMLEVIAKGIDAVFGKNLADSVKGWRSSLKGMVEEKFGPGIEVMPIMDNVDSFNKGYNFGGKLGEKVGSVFGMGLSNDYSLGSSLVSDVGSIADSAGNISDSLSVTSEDLKYLRDIAEQEAVNRFTTAEIRVDMGGVSNTVNQNTDLDGMMDYMESSIEEAMERVAEGVPA